jgi:hypothetical protein
MSKHRRLRRSDLFLLRLWSEAREGEQREPTWHGKIQRVVDGETRQFSDWDALLAILAAMLSQGSSDGQEGVTTQGNITQVQEGTDNG